MFLPIRFKTNVELTPHDLTQDFNAKIKEKLQTKLEGICTRYGYIKPGSLDIIRRSSGKFIKQHFNGHIHFDILCKGEVCNPPKGLIVEAQVKNKNTLGLLAEGIMKIDDTEVSILDIIVPKKAAGIVSEINIDTVEIGDTINIMIMGKRFQMNDNKISIIGRAVKNKVPVKEEPLESNDEAEIEGDIDEDDLSDVESFDDDESKEGDNSDEDEVKGGTTDKSKVVLVDVEEDNEDDDVDDEYDDDIDEEDYDDEDIEGGDIYYDEG